MKLKRFVPTSLVLFDTTYGFPTAGILGRLSRARPQSPSSDRRTGITRELQVTESVFRVLETFLPARLCREDLGDGLELVASLAKDGCPTGEIYRVIARYALRVAVVNGVRE